MEETHSGYRTRIRGDDRIQKTTRWDTGDLFMEISNAVNKKGNQAKKGVSHIMSHENSRGTKRKGGGGIKGEREQRGLRGLSWAEKLRTG